MVMTMIFYGILYAAAAIFLAACAARAVGYARLPLHLRWELYPVPHEKKERAEHGGSYFESTNWWTKPQRSNPFGDWKFMFLEILFLKGLWEFKRKMWYRSYPFHLGLYLLVGAGGLLLLLAGGSLIAPGLLETRINTSLHYIYVAMGVLGAVLTLCGAASLLVSRLTDPELRPYTTAGDIFNLGFFIFTVGFMLAGYFSRSENSPGGLTLARGILTFDTTLTPPAIFEVGMILAAVLAAYIPMTHMSHFIGKYFTYHSVRWDDKPNRISGALERKLAAYLTYRPTWAAAHFGADGLKTWADVVTSNPTRGGKQ